MKPLSAASAYLTRSPSIAFSFHSGRLQVHARAFLGSPISRNAAPSLHSLALRSKEGGKQYVVTPARHYKAWCLLVEVSMFFEA